MQMSPSPPYHILKNIWYSLAVIERVWTKKGERPIADAWPSSRLVKALWEGEASCCHGILPSTVESGHSFPEWRILASYCHRYKRPHMSNELIISVSYWNEIIATHPAVVIWQLISESQISDFSPVSASE